MKKSGFFLLVLALLMPGASLVLAQDCRSYFPVHSGAVREMKSYDKKDKLTGTVRQKITSVEQIPGGISILVNAEMYDDKDKLVSGNNLKMTCVNGIFTMDMKNLIDQSIWAGTTGLEVKIDATDLEFPGELAVGQQLKDASLDLQALNMGIPMIKMNVRITDRKVEAIEDITTTAGTFSCYKITYTTETQYFGKYTGRATDWYAEGVGTVRSESYDKNSKLVSYSLLTALEN